MNQHSLFDPPSADPATTPDLEQQVADLHRIIEDQRRQLHDQLDAIARPAAEAVRAERQRAGKIALAPADIELAARLAVGSPDVVSAARFLTNLSEDYGWDEATPLRTELLAQVAEMPDLSWDTLWNVLRACNGDEETLEDDLFELIPPLLGAAAREHMPEIAQMRWVRDYRWDASDRDTLAALLSASISQDAISAGIVEVGFNAEEARSDLLFWLRTAGPIVHSDTEERMIWFLKDVAPAADSGGYIVGDLIEGLTELVEEWMYDVPGEGEATAQAGRILRVLGCFKTTKSWYLVLDADRVRAAIADLKAKARKLMDDEDDSTDFGELDEVD